MIDSDHPSLSIARQCQLLSISRSGFYYQPSGESELNLTLMRLIDEQHMRTPYYGARQMARYLRREGYVVCRKRRMGLCVIYQRPRNRCSAAFSTWLSSWTGRAARCLAWRVSNTMNTDVLIEYLESL